MTRLIAAVLAVLFAAAARVHAKNKPASSPTYPVRPSFVAVKCVSSIVTAVLKAPR